MYTPVGLDYIHDIWTACFMLQRIPLTFFELFSKFDKNYEFFFLRGRFLGHFRGNNMDSGLPKGSPVSFHLRTTWN